MTLCTTSHLDAGWSWCYRLWDTQELCDDGNRGVSRGCDLRDGYGHHREKQPQQTISLSAMAYSGSQWGYIHGCIAFERGWPLNPVESVAFNLSIYMVSWGQAVDPSTRLVVCVFWFYSLMIRFVASLFILAPEPYCHVQWTCYVKRSTVVLESV